MIEALAVFAFVAIAAFVFIFVQMVLRLQHDPIRDRLASAAGEDNFIEQRTLTGGGFSELLAAQLPQFQGDTKRLEQELRRAGYYRRSARNEFLALRNALVLGGALITGGVAVLLGGGQHLVLLKILAVGGALTGLCWAIPRVFLKIRGSARVKRIRRALPDALDMITMCLTGGLSLADALAHVSREIYFAHPDLAVELLIICQQAQMRSFEHAFNQFAHRIDAPEIIALSSLITQGQRFGTDVVGSIRDYADEMRLRRRQHADERSSKAGVKLLFPLTMCALPSVFILLWGPSILELWDFLQSFEGVRITQ